ncbi:MAG: acetyl-CoA decarbonylase/synthase complex subunit delta [Chloroflexi bacterium]|nr:acetyl-CoA decarbonylase/synthase complex subunit delta [Chloroflexota bacterium]
MPVTVEIPKDKYAGKVREIVLGATKEQGGTRAKTVTIGGESTLPYLHFEGNVPHPPAIAVEVQDRKPGDWSPVLLDAWKEVADDPVKWAKAAEALGVDLILLKLNATQADGSKNNAANARKVVRQVLQATGLPLFVFGPGQAELDNELLVAVAEEAKGERIVLGVCEDKNYRTIVAAAMANDQLVDSRTPMDVNLAKQLVILIHDMGLPLERIVMDPTTGALGYGIEYGYSVMERLRLAALQGDGMTQQPMLVTPGEEAWRVKESKVGADVPAMWGDWAERAVYWETVTASALVESGANVLVMRHPDAIKRVQMMVAGLMSK